MDSLGICRCCLSESSDSWEPLFDHKDLNFDQMFSQTFGKILFPSDEMRHKICLECQEIILKAYNFKIKVYQTINILLGNDGSTKQDLNSLVEDKNTQTEPMSLHDRKSKPPEQQSDIIQFDEENFDSINLQSDDGIFESQANPLTDINVSTQSSVRVKTEQSGLTDEEYDSAENIDEEDPSNWNDDEGDILIVKSESSEDLVCDVNPFNRSDENKEQIDSKHRLHKCEQCNKSFSRATHLKRHKLTHEEGRIQCSVCDKRFTRIDHLNLHIASNHSDSKPHQCDVADCKKGFVRQEHLKKHIEAKHTETTKDKETCDICKKTFSSKKYLRTHMKSHSSESKGLACKYCSREFLEKTDLNEHLTKDHQNEKPYLCSECGLRFVRNDYLVIHMRRHMGVKPYKCRFCEKGFPRATDLTVHERYHTNEKTHLCNLCGKGFQRAYNLLVHMRVHTGEKPYQCSFCNKSFSQGNDLKAHIRRHTGERFKCDLCSEGFIQGYHLTHHKRTVHGLDVKSHIRRVEKFVSPSTVNQSEDEKQLIDTQEDVKPETEFQFEIIQN